MTTTTETTTTTCEVCGRTLQLDVVDGDGTLIGAECSCGYYVTRYLPGQSPDGEVTPRTTDVVAWLDATYPEGDASVAHTDGCDRVSCGDECVGGCPVVITYEV